MHLHCYNSRVLVLLRSHVVLANTESCRVQQTEDVNKAVHSVIYQQTLTSAGQKAVNESMKALYLGGGGLGGGGDGLGGGGLGGGGEGGGGLGGGGKGLGGGGLGGGGLQKKTAPQFVNVNR